MATLEGTDEQLIDFENKHANNWLRLIYQLRRHLDFWSTKHIQAPLWHIKHAYLPVLFNIPVAGTTATEIGHRALVQKQNLSRTIREMEKEGIISARRNREDKRSERLALTPEAKDFVLDTHFKLAALQSDYKNLVGEQEWKIATNVLLKIIAYHEKLEESEKHYPGTNSPA